ncbi:MAG: phosphohydrolase [Verrucomicrobiales bacterium]|nr:phosphohydrolase [Verrucomicrobiales bacterium]
MNPPWSGVICPDAELIMKTSHKILLSGVLLGILSVAPVHGATTILSDSYNVTGTGSGFALNAGVNSGINPPTTRLTGSVAAGLRYINTGTKATNVYTITTSKAKVTSAINPGRFTPSANGTTAFDFAPALAIANASPANPAVYDLSISIDNDSVGTQRSSFALGTAEGDATTWDFGFQVYRNVATDNFYTIGKRIDTGSSGLAADLNASVLTMAAATYGTEITILMRVTDAGAQTSGFNSRVQLSINGGSTWFYDTATDANLTSGWRLDGASRILMWDIAPDAAVTYDNFSLNWNSGPRIWNGLGANANWNNTTNWNGAVPINGSALIFNGTTRPANTNNLVGLTVPYVAFNNGGFTLWGNTFTNTSALTNLAGVNTLKAGLDWSSTAVKTWSIATGGELLLDNTTTIRDIGDHSVIGGGTLRQKGTMNFTANPAFAINEGKHIIDGGTFNTIGGYRVGSLATGPGAQTILTNGANLTITAAGGNLRVGDSANPVASRLDIDNSTLTLAGGVHLALPYAAGAIGVINQVGGTVTPGTILFNDVGAGTGTYTIKNGTLVAKQIRKNITGGSSSIFFDNATVRTDAGALSPFMNTLDVAQIQAGGLTLDVLSDIIVDQTLSGTGALSKTGSAALTLNTNNSFSGGATLTAGTLTVGNNAALGTGTITINGGTLTGTGGAKTLSGAVVVGGNFTVAGIEAVTLSGGVNLGSATRSIAATSSGTTTLSGIVSGTGGLTKDGTGVLQLSGSSANTYSGNTLVNAGTLLLAKTAGNALPGNVTIGDGIGTDTVQLNAANQIADSAVVTIAAGGSLNLNGFSETIGSVSSASASSQIILGAGTLTVGDTSANTFAGTVSGTGNLVKQGSGTVTLSGANSFSGTTTISAGTLALGAGGSIASSPSITIVSGATFNVSAVSGYAVGASQTLIRNASSGAGNVNGSVAFTSGAQVSLQADGTAGSIGTLSIVGGLTLNGNTLTININSSPLGAGTYPLVTYSGAKSGSFNSTPVITGSGVAPGYLIELVETTGQISLRIYSTGRNWSGGGTDGNWSTVANWDGVAPVTGDKLIFNGTTRLINTNNISGLSVPSVNFNSDGFALYGNALTVTAAITNATGNNALNAGLTLGAALRIQSDSGAFTLGGIVSGAGGLTKEGNSLLQLSGASANTYSGATLVNAGTLSLAKSAGVNAIAGSITVGDGVGGAAADILRLDAADQIVDSGAVDISGSGRFDLNSFSETVASISSASSFSQVVLGSGTLTVGDASASTFAGSISGSGSLVKQGAGTLTLSGANTHTGATTISAGTVALAVGGSLASTTISLASSATYNVSAIAGYALTASQTLSRNSATGAGTVTGAVTFASGAKASLTADGTTGTVGTLNISGNITLSANVITVNVTGGPLDVGTYSLITYTGTKTGSFNVTPTITGSGLGMGLVAKIVESAGLISVKVFVPAHGVSAASIKVIEKDLANTTNSVEVTTTVSINGLLVRDGSSRGDYTVQVGTSATDDLTTGVLVTSVAENGRDHGEDSGINYCTSAMASTSTGYFIPTATTEDGAEYNINVSAAFFPYAKWLGGYARNSAGTVGGANDLLTASSGLTLGTHFVDNGAGLSTVNLSSFGINSQTDGVLLVTAGANNNYYASSKANTDGTWSVYVKNNLTNSTTTAQGPVAFAFIPKTNVSIISGKFHGDGTILMYNGSSARFSVTNTTNGTWKLTIPGYSSSKGVLVISAEGGAPFNADNVVSAQPSGNDWIIQSRDIPGMGLQTPPEAAVSFVFIPAPTATLVAPANNATNIASAPSLKVTANNTAGGNLTVTFFGHRLAVPGPGPDFLIPVLPDTQNYAREAAGSGTATKEMWFAQMDWIIANRVSENIPFVATLGDCVNNADQLFQWKNATNANYRLEKQSSTQLLEGIPYGITVGNHDQDPNGDPDGSTAFYNQYFGSSHFTGKSYYGGHYDTNNDSWYDLFSAGGMDFLVISFEYGRYGSLIMDWANNVIATYPTRRVLVLTHHAGDDTPDDTVTAPFSTQGAAIYAALKPNPNFFMMLGGHVFNEGGEGRRSDTFNGHTVRTLISDYQGRFNGGNGLMRLMYFSPANNTISIKTFSPYTGNFETDANSQFSYTYNMQPNGAGSPATAYTALKTNINVVAGTQTSNTWSGLLASKGYEWYVTVADELGDYSTSPEWKFTTTAGFARTASNDANADGIPDDWEATYGITDAKADNDGDGQSNFAEFIANTNPTNAASVLRVVDTKLEADGQVTLTWSSVGGTRYRVQYADGLDGDFNDIEQDTETETDHSPSGEPSTQSFTDADAVLNGVRFYRIKVVP